MSSFAGPATIVVDTSVLINFLRIDRMDLIGSHPDSFIATEHAVAEITDTNQRERYAAALALGYLVECRIDDPTEIALFVRLSREGRLGAGERSAIAVALSRNCRLGIQDNRAIGRAVREAEQSETPIAVVRTQDIVVELIRCEKLAVEAADALLVDWANNHRFKLKISTFGELL